MRWVTLGLAAAALGVLGCSPTPDLSEADGPGTAARQVQGIILLDIDTLRADRLGCYGNPRPTSPHIDRLADQGVRFERAFGQAPNTPPSQSSILTSLYPSTHGVKSRKDRLSPEITTLVEVLRGVGWSTGGFVDGGYMSAAFGLGQGFELYDDEGGGLATMGPKVIAWLRSHAEEKFFLLVHTYDVHTPYDPPEPYRSLFLDGLEPPSPGFEPSAEQMEAVRASVWTDRPRRLSEADLGYALALYDGGIRYVDDWVGELLDELGRLGLRDRVLVTLVSDHGEEFQEHGSVLHEKLYATVTHIPWILSWPGGERGEVIPEVVESLDIMPTLLELAGAPLPAGIQGVSQVPRLEGGEMPPRPAFSESRFFGRQWAVTEGDSRLIFTLADRRYELYRLPEDPFEQQNLAASEPRATRRLHQLLAGWSQRIGTSSRYHSVGGEPDEVTLEQLRALGYIP